MRAEAETIQRAGGSLFMLRLILISLRPWEWIKNAFLFAALFFSKNLLQPELLWKSILAFCLYCLAAGAVYVINDVWDKQQDRNHPQKSTRPIASGALPVALAVAIAVTILAIAIVGAFVLTPLFGLVTTGYVLLSVVYSKWLKHTVILDVFSIATGFVLRVVAGAVAIDVMMSNWLLICTMLLALFLGFSKRRHELVTLAGDASLHRRVLAEYNPLFLDMMIGIVTSATVVSYVLYTVSAETVQKFHTDRLILTVPFVLYGIFRYLYLVYHRSHGGAPARTLMTDKPLIFNMFLWGLLSAFIIYTADW